MRRFSIASFLCSPPFLALLAGGLAGFSFPPWNIQPFFFLALLFFFQRLPTPSSLREAFKNGMGFSFGLHITSLYWGGHPFVVLGLWYLSPLGFLCLPLFLASLLGTVFAGAWRYSISPLSHALCLTLLWVLYEWIVGHYILGGFPWILAGYIWDLPFLQATSVLGIYGVSLLTILAASLLALCPKPRIWIGVLLSLGAIWGWGQYRLSDAELSKDPKEIADMNMRLVQPSIEQEEKWSPEHLKENLLKHMVLSQVPGEKPLKAVIWPEASVPQFITPQMPLFEHLKFAVPPSGVLIFGAPRRVFFSDNDWECRTSLHVLDSKGHINAVYDKAHVVPFGEYFPFKWIIDLPKLTFGTKDYSPGPGLATLSCPPVPPFSPLVCFEAIFSGSVTIREKEGPQWLLNVTNDAWFGKIVGPYQHLAIVRVRAIEEGLPLARAANNGISAVIDPYGRILHQLSLDAVGYIDFTLPAPLKTPTLFVRLGHTVFFFMLTFIILTLGVLCRVRRWSL